MDNTDTTLWTHPLVKAAFNAVSLDRLIVREIEILKKDCRGLEPEFVAAQVLSHLYPHRRERQWVAETFSPRVAGILDAIDGVVSRKAPQDDAEAIFQTGRFYPDDTALGRQVRTHYLIDGVSTLETAVDGLSKVLADRDRPAYAEDVENERRDLQEVVDFQKAFIRPLAGSTGQTGLDRHYADAMQTAETVLKSRTLAAGSRTARLSN